MIKRKVLLFLCLLINIINVLEVKADGPVSGGGTVNANAINDGSGDNSGKGNYSEWTSFRVGNKQIKYRYKVSYSTSLNYDWKYIMPNGNVIKSGTWVGLKVNEIQSASWSVSDIEYEEVKKVYTCTTTTSYCCYKKHAISNPFSLYDSPQLSYVYVCNGDKGYDASKCTNPSYSTQTSEEEKEYYEEYACPSGSKETVEEEVIALDSPGAGMDKSGDVYKIAHSTAVGLVGAPLSKLQITTDELDSSNEYKAEIITGQLVSSTDSGIASSGAVSKTYTYQPSNICMNLKTGKVSYNKECQSEEEVQINPYVYSNVNYWQYFSPLDMKSGTNFSLVIKNNTERILNEKECHSIMNNYSKEYQNYIISLKSKSLKGDYCKNSSCSNVNKGNNSDWQEVSNGCYFSTVINFDVSQKYYYEEEENNTLKFNGYNIYYRSININNPFPTIPTENSLWYEWYNSTNKNPNLKDSFKAKTYSVVVSNKLADTIRAYNVNNPYPSFNKLSLTGKSEFLESIGVSALTTDTNYELGEGAKTCIKGKKITIGSDCS